MAQKNNFRYKDIPLFVSTDPNKLKIPSLASLAQEMDDMKGGRIPALINVKLSMLHTNGLSGDVNSVLIAAADVGNEGADWGYLSLGIRRSYDNGVNWTRLSKVLSLQAHHAPQTAEDWQSPFVIDPVMVQAGDGSVLVLIDMFPESMGFHKSNWMDTNSYQEIDGKLYLILYDGESSVNNRQNANQGNYYTVRENGWVYDSFGLRTNYYMPQKHSSLYRFATIGDLYYAVDTPDYIDKEPPLFPDTPKAGQDIYVGNVFISNAKPQFHINQPVFVQKRFVGPGYPIHSDYETVETECAPLTACVSMHLWVIRSLDGGTTWEQPFDITSQVKLNEDGPFLGTGPGVGVLLTKQEDPNRNGRIVIPLYNGTDRKERAAVIYSDDNGITWTRSKTTGFTNNKDESQIIELFDGTLMCFGRQNELCDVETLQLDNKESNPWRQRFPNTPVSYSIDGGDTWSESTTTPLSSVMCQKSVIAYPIDYGNDKNSVFSYPDALSIGKQYIICSRPTGISWHDQSTRSDGTISIGEVLADHSIRWIAHKIITDDTYCIASEDWLKNFFAYSSLCVLDNGNIGLLYEPLPNNYIAFAQFSLEWITTTIS